MIQGIQYTGLNTYSVLLFCGDNASYFSNHLRVNSVKEYQQLVRPSDFIFKSSKGNLCVRSRDQFFSQFKANDGFEYTQLTKPFILAYKNDTST